MVAPTYHIPGISAASCIGDIKGLLKGNPKFFNNETHAQALNEKFKRIRDHNRDFGTRELSVYGCDVFAKEYMDSEFIELIMKNIDISIFQKQFKPDEYPAIYTALYNYVMMVWESMGIPDVEDFHLCNSYFSYIFACEENRTLAPEFVSSFLEHPDKHPNAFRQYVGMVFNVMQPTQFYWERIDQLTEVIMNMPNGIRSIEDKGIVNDETAGKLIDAYGLEGAQEILGAIGVIQDVATNRMAGRDFFINCCYWYHNRYYVDMIHQIADRYRRYFMDEDIAAVRVVDMLSYLDIGTGNVGKNKNAAFTGQTTFASNVITLISTLYQDGNADMKPSIIRQFLNDIVNAFGYRTRVGDMDKYVDMYQTEIATESFRIMDLYTLYENRFAMEAAGDDMSKDRDPSLHENAKVRKTTKPTQNMTNKIYKAYTNYKNAEQNVDSQITKALTSLKTAIQGGDARTQIIEGRQFSAIGLLKKLLGTVAIFSYSKIAGVIFLVVRHTLRKNATQAEKVKVLSELRQELEIVEEKIQDARGDENREAKYALMRTRGELQDAIRRIEYGIGAAGAKKIQVTEKTGLKAR